MEYHGNFQITAAAVLMANEYEAQNGPLTFTGRVWIMSKALEHAYEQYEHSDSVEQLCRKLIDPVLNQIEMHPFD